MGFNIQLLGPLRVRAEDLDITPNAPKLRTIVAFFAARNGDLVRTEELIDELWPEDPPRSAQATVHTYVYKLRKTFLSLVTDPRDCPLTSEPLGYRFAVPADCVDVTAFGRLSETAAGLLEDGDADRAVETADEALRMIAGTLLGGVLAGETLTAFCLRWEDVRLRTMETRIEAVLRLGRYRQAVADLRELTHAHPTHEEFHRQFMVALHHSGRRAEALAAYQRLRQQLASELGLDPSPQIQRTHEEILNAEYKPAMVRPRPTAEPFGPPAQLPPTPIQFVGRRAEIERAVAWLTPEVEGGSSVPVVAICGMPGVGKSALALRIAHLLKQHFPDGHLYVSLRGSSETPVEPQDALTVFLRASGIPETEIPHGYEHVAGLYRTWTAQRRMLIILDDAANAEHVRALLPGGSQCAVIATSRQRQRTDLARTIAIGALRPKEGAELLTTILADHGVSVDNETIDRLLCRCGYLPAAIHGAGTRLVATAPQGTTRCVHAAVPAGPDYAEQYSLPWFEDEDLRSRFDASYRMLNNTEREVFHLLGQLDGTAFTVQDVAGDLGHHASKVVSLLQALVDRSLVDVVDSASPGITRYAMHPVTKLYASLKTWPGGGRIAG